MEPLSEEEKKHNYFKVATQGHCDKQQFLGKRVIERYNETYTIYNHLNRMQNNIKKGWAFNLSYREFGFLDEDLPDICERHALKSKLKKVSEDLIFLRTREQRANELVELQKRNRVSK